MTQIRHRMKQRFQQQQTDGQSNDGMPESQQRVHRRRTTRLERAGWWVLALYGLTLVLHIVPWYHPGFRPPVQLANGALLVAGALAIVLVLVPAYARRQQWGWLLASLSAGLALFMGTGQAHAWRLAWTDHLLQTRHCNDSTQASGTRVLGGLVRTGGLGAGGGAEYVNSTHCLFVVCREEFFPCLRPSPAQDVRHP
ncbi:hypothetical protein [Acidovorax sp.]|uniref:hypothetical protein n=1 Tax=Acidovorax sp. TaxID=1872122 RepID=UPI002ACE256D|nr:hypothetical protein [Acidovorax sp.]MDZ7863720.1 hypothetical protein [Acidovorax sp.]